MIEFKKILVPYDFTENAAKVIPHVVSLSQKYDATICFMHVVEDLARWGIGAYVPHLPLESFRKEALEGARQAMDTFCAEELGSCASVRKILSAGDPVEEILKTIEQEAIDLVIMATHGRKGLEHTIFGSVAENVLRRSSAPVLTINPHTIKK